jgi:murein DD-endopeptidase MepM/ murein hydrolase activator NlpD
MAQGPIYIVQAGDTLNSIALRFGISAEDLQQANGIADPNNLKIGQRLVIPGLQGISGVLTSEVLSYGTSLTYLTRQYQLAPEDLVTLNKLTSPSETIAGLKFIIPIVEGQESLSAIAQIGPEETILETAIRTGTTHWQMISNNQLQGSWDVLSGEMLFGTPPEPGSSESALPGISRLGVEPLPAIQGETLEVILEGGAEKGLTVSGHFQDQSTPFFQENNQFFGFFGIHALAEPGPYPLQVEVGFPDGTSVRFEQMVLMAPGFYGNDPVIYVDDVYVDPETIAAEDQIVESILSQTSSEKYWEGKFQYPIDEPCVMGYFGQRRSYNDGALYYYHTGLDFGVCAQNLNIYAPAAGKVVLAEEMTVRGKAVLIDHGWGIFSGYWHLAEFNVQVGDSVQTGDLLGLIGNTGRSAGPHLHFEINISGIPVNPEQWLEREYP